MGKQVQLNTVILFTIIVVGGVFHLSTIGDYPAHTHVWAQSDRYAISLGFLNNNFNFFLPETYVYNTQFPDNWLVPYTNTITAVDFPLHDYIVALLMKILGTKSPAIFKGYMLLYSCVGLMYLFKLALLLTKDMMKSIFIVMFACTVPVFLDFQSSILPTIPSLANAIIGIYFYTLYLTNQRTKFFALSIFFFTLGALCRMTFVIPLVAILSFETLQFFRKKTTLKPKVWPVVFSLLILLGYFFYNGYLRKMYGSLFLNHLLPANNIEQALTLLNEFKSYWWGLYFTKYHIVVLCAAIFVFCAQKIRRKLSLSSSQQSLFIIVGVILLGCMLFTLAMLQQFKVHHYYFLDTFYLPVILLLILCIAPLPWPQQATIKWGMIVIAILFLGNVMYNGYVQTHPQKRVEHWDKTAITIQNFTGKEKLFDSLGIPKTAKIEVIDSYIPNGPFILMNRKGYTIMSTTRESIQKAIKWEYDYIVFQNRFFMSNLFARYPEFLNETKILYTDGQIAICKRKKKESKTTLFDYFGLSSKKALWQNANDFEGTSSTKWENVNTSTEKTYKGSYVTKLTPEQKYGITYKTKKLPVLQQKRTTLCVDADMYSETGETVSLTVALHEAGQNTYYQVYEVVPDKKSWKKVQFLYHLPQVKETDYEFSMFIYNSSQTTFWIDAIKLSLFDTYLNNWEQADKNR